VKKSEWENTKIQCMEKAKRKAMDTNTGEKPRTPEPGK